MEKNNNIYKKCSKCNKKKTINMFHKNGNRFRPMCKPCRNKCCKLNRKTIDGFINAIYSGMNYRTKGRTKKTEQYKNKSILPRDKFVKWSKFNKDFRRLFKLWSENNYIKGLTPSINRINSYLGYDLDNIEWTTYSMNSYLGATSPKRMLKTKKVIYKLLENK